MAASAATPGASAGSGATPAGPSPALCERACDLLNQRLAECIDLQMQCKQAHWNVRGANFIALHELFDDINGAVEDYVDLVAERVMQLGGVAEGTLGSVVAGTSLPPYPPCGSEATRHLQALATALSTFGSGVRRGIDEMTQLGDAASADILTEILRGIDKWLWFVEAHLPARAAPASA
ncbi:DNA starvation/stationary phase protection protein Dps [Variovorax sp. OV329]|uniref:DNA starvation/stationary phase protection protein Dps n=1 Tax=Variovorax sp. OV329 TaxID=1882825 RepID=UPI0008DF1FB7|nr:DNA starvation/stationary phase protection protein Dps [Variovorax sp. OV329]SFN01314.1 starvation-inducible DNA-binding protein [Variovorax sp. OV329]